jgi:heterotetrameric sarcosine oxidase gamma subunit
MMPGIAIVTDTTVTALPAAPLHAFEIWSNPPAVADRFKAAMGSALPAIGQSLKLPAMQLIRFEPTVWLVEGDIDGLAEVLGTDGSLTAIGGGVVRVRLTGPGWRSLLMEGGVFDAESAAFTTGCSSTTLIDHVNVRLLVEGEDSCLAYVPLSYAHDMKHFWQVAARTLP